MAKSKLKFDSNEQRAYLLLWRTYDLLRGVEEHLFNLFDITPQQYNVLRILKSVHPATLPTLEIGERMISRAPDITRLLDRLEKKGYVKRTRQEANRRIVAVEITQEGISLLREISGPVKRCGKKQLSHLSNLELDELVRLLDKARSAHETSDGFWDFYGDNVNDSK